MSKVESFTYTKSVTVGIPPTTKSFGLTVRLPEQFTEQGLHEAIARAEMLIDDILNQPEKANIPNLDLAEINDLPWRTFVKGSLPGSAKKGFLTTSGPNAADLVGWCFREENIPDGSTRTKSMSVELADTIEKVGGKLEIGEWTFTLKGDTKNLINRSKREKK